MLNNIFIIIHRFEEQDEGKFYRDREYLFPSTDWSTAITKQIYWWQQQWQQPSKKE